MEPFHKEVSSYFDYSPKKHTTTEPPQACSPTTIEISASAQRRAEQRAVLQSPHFRSQSHDELKHKKRHFHTIDEDATSQDTSTQGSRSSPVQQTPLANIQKRRGGNTDPSIELSGDHSTPPIFDKGFSGTVLTSNKANHRSHRRRPRLDHVWVRSTSWSAWFEANKNSTAETLQPSSSRSVAATPDSGVLHVRTDQTPLRPPTSKSTPPLEPSISSSIKVETEFPEPKQKSPQDAPCTEPQIAPSSRRSSVNPKHIFSVPLQAMRRLSVPKRQNKGSRTPAHQPSPEARRTRLADHPSQLKRNYTSEVLQRVTAILQDIKPGSQSSVWPASVVRPLRWRTFSDKSTSYRDKRDPHFVEGIISQFSHNQRKSVEQLSDARSYTSSQRNLRMGIQPTNTPDEQATYKVKRSPSAQTEEFLKVDISIRGGTSYLPSEARRIHTPPLPEEGMDGKWRGFFFDYNAPRRTSSLRIEESNLGGHGWSSGNASPGTSDVESRSRSTTLSKKLDRTKSKNTKRIMTGDWYDVKLAELDVDVGLDQEVISSVKEGDKRMNSPECLSEVLRKREMEQFDLTIPEHLPSSPLCPRHPRYWRVIRGKGSQFRGCWMHGVGVYEEAV